MDALITKDGVETKLLKQEVEQLKIRIQELEAA